MNNMECFENNLISYKTAKLAKEKGFSEKSHFYYDDNEKLVEFINTNNDGFNEPSACYLFSLQKWLRDNYNIIIEPFAYYDETSLPLNENNIAKPSGYFYWKLYDEDFSPETCDKFSSYEEALDYGLQVGLNLIK